MAKGHCLNALSPYHRPCDASFASVLSGLALAGATVVAAEPELRLRFSGVIGQSQPPNTEPYPAIQCQGVARDGSGRLWVAPGGPNILIMQQEADSHAATQSGGNVSLPIAGPGRSGHSGEALGAGWEVHDRLELPAPAAARTVLRWDGRTIWAWCADHRLVAIASATKKVIATVRLPADTAQIEIAPAEFAAGFAAVGKMFVLIDSQVQAFAADGTAVGRSMLTLPPIADGKYTGLGLEPGSGDLIVGTGYPDMKLYRFAPDGRQVTGGGWPRAGWPQQFVALDGIAWMLAANGPVQSVPAERRTDEDVKSFSPAWMNYPAGFAPDGAGGWWIASSQGLVRFSATGSAKERIGGLCGVRNLAVAADGTVVAAVENGQRMLRFGLDDAPDTPLRGNANEPWRTAAGWKSRSAGLASDVIGFVVLDETENRLWRFDPEHTAWSEKPWIPLTPAGTFAKARALAVGDALAWILDGDRLLEAERSTWTFRPMALPGIESPAVLTGLAAVWDRFLIGCTTRGIYVWQRTPDPRFRARWTLPDAFRSIAAIAATDEMLAVADAEAGTVSVLSLADGRQLGTVDGPAVPGGMKPRAITFSGPWLLVADDAGKRLLRFKCER